MGSNSGYLLKSFLLYLQWYSQLTIFTILPVFFDNLWSSIYNLLLFISSTSLSIFLLICSLSVGLFFANLRRISNSSLLFTFIFWKVNVGHKYYSRIKMFYNLINNRHGSQMLLQTIWLWNHKSHTKVYFN